MTRVYEFPVEDASNLAHLMRASLLSGDLKKQQKKRFPQFQRDLERLDSLVKDLNKAEQSLPSEKNQISLLKALDTLLRLEVRVTGRRPLEPKPGLESAFQGFIDSLGRAISDLSIFALKVFAARKDQASLIVKAINNQVSIPNIQEIKEFSIRKAADELGKTVPETEAPRFLEQYSEQAAKQNQHSGREIRRLVELAKMDSDQVERELKLEFDRLREEA
jgi:hypothetical protein